MWSAIGYQLFDSFKTFGDVDNQYRLIVRNVFGDKFKVAQPGYKFTNPFKKKYLLYMGERLMVVSFNSTLNDADKLELSVKPVFVHFQVADDRIENIEKVFKNRDSLDTIKTLINTLIKDIVNHSIYDQLKSLSIINGVIPDIYKQIPNTRDDKSTTVEGYQRIGKDDLLKNVNFVEQLVYNRLSIIYQQYGIKITKILFGDVDYVSGLNEQIARQKKEQIENEINLAKAKNELEVAKLKAEAQTYIERVPYDILFKAVEENKLSPEQIYKILERQATKANATIIENSGGTESLTNMLFAEYMSRAKGHQVNVSKVENGKQNTYNGRNV